MKELFVHHPIFRLLSPLFSGTLVYLLILLVNNNISQLEETFLGQELYVCIGLAYLIQEFARLSLLFFKKIAWPRSFTIKVAVHILISIAATVALVSAVMFLYFHYFLFYTPNFTELSIFNSIFAFITLIYIILYLSHHFLYKMNTHKIEREIRAKKSIEADVVQFKKGINPELLFDTLEAFMANMKKSPDKVEKLAERFSSIFRYILTKRNKELVPIADEISVLREFVSLFDNLPYRKVILRKIETDTMWLPPTTLVTIIEQIIRTTILSEHQAIKIDIVANEKDLTIQYQPEERLRRTLSIEDLSTVSDKYRYYSTREVRIVFEKGMKKIQLPKLKYNESSHT